VVHGSGKGLEVVKVVMAEDGIDICLLGEMHSMTHTIMFDLDAEHLVELTKVSDLDMCAEPSLEFLNKIDGGGNNCIIANVHNHNNELALELDHFEVDGLVNSTLLKAKGDEDARKLLVSVVARLFKAIEHFDKAQDACAGIGVFVARRMLHVQHLILIEFTVEICTLDVNLVHLYAKAISHCDDSVCGCKFSHWHIHVIVVNAADLAEALSDKTGLVAYNIACHVLLCLKDLL
jgi:hypothetical protein